MVQGVVDALGFHLGAHLTLEEPIGGAFDGAGGVGRRVELHGFSYGADENGNTTGDALGPTANSAVGDSAARFALRVVARALAFDEDKETLRRRHGDEATSTPEQRAEWTPLTRNVIYAYLTKNPVTGLIRDAR